MAGKKLYAMAKRFSDTDKFKKPFFRGLSGAYKLLWDYLYHNCDNAGIWIKDFEIAQIYVGSDMPITEDQAIKNFAGRITIFDNGAKWFIPAFIEFQYDCTVEGLNPNNNAHLSVIKKLKKEGLISPSPEAQDKYKEEDKDKVKDLDKDKYIVVDSKKIYDPLPILEFYEAQLNGTQKENGNTAWKPMVPVWFEQHLLEEFKDDMHVKNSFKKHYINLPKVNGQKKVDTKDYSKL
jgi:hypothetical protein